jgi:hypothetical protein
MTDTITLAGLVVRAPKYVVAGEGTLPITSVDKEQRVIVVGRLRVRDWEKDDRIGTTVQVVADSLAHDLS